MPGRTATLRRSLVRAALVAAAAAVAALLSLGVVVGTVVAAPGESSRPIANPDLHAACGIDILVILDESGSIDSAHAAGDVRDAFRALLDGLDNTGSRVGVIEFDTQARLPLPGAASRAYTTVTDATINTIFDPYITNDYDPDGSTHWEDAFRAARYFLPRPSQEIPHLVLFITDGDPNRIVRNDRVTYNPGSTNVAQNEYELKIPLSDDETTSADENPAKDRAVSNANALKAMGSHILTVAVGKGLDSGSSLQRIIDVSGPDVFSGTGTFDIATDDVYREEDFSELEEAMGDAAFALCAPSVNVRKTLDMNPDPAVDDLQPGQGWSMTATVAPTPATWVLPSGASGATVTGTTGADGFVTFQWTTGGQGSSTINVTEAVQSGFVNDPSATRCTYRTPDTNGNLPLPGFSATANGFSGTVPFKAIVTCEMVNRVPPTPAVQIEKLTNGVDADTPPGPPIAAGSAVTWTYVVTNTGNVPLSNVTVVDNKGVPVTCDDTSIPAGGQTECHAAGTAQAGQYANTGTVTARGPGPSGMVTVTDSDPSHYFGSAPGIDIEKSTNGVDADSPPGPFIPVGNTVTWTYVVTNTGNQPLTGATVADDVVGPITCPAAIDPLDPGEIVTCTAAGTAAAGPYANVATVTATGSGGAVEDSDGSHYFGSAPAIQLTKFVNGQDANTAPGPQIDVGRPVAWTYRIENTGNVPLTWSLTDDQFANAACPRLFLLVPGQVIFCFGLFGATAQAGQHVNVGTVTGTTLITGVTVTDSDPANYFGVLGAIDLEKLTNDVDADAPPGPFVVPGSTVTWTYRVHNTGNAALSNVVVEDLNGVAVTCPPEIAPLAVDETVDCAATGIAQPDQYTNLSTVTAETPTGIVVTDNDPSNYFGSIPGIDIQKSTNGDDADLAPGPFIPVGAAVDWTYVVHNTGNVVLTAVVVTDDQGVTVTCPPEIDPLALDEVVTCTGTGTAAEGPYSNVASVSGTGPAGQALSDSDPSNYFGFVSEVQIVKATNGDDANVAPGVLVPVGGPVTWTYTVTNPGNVPIRNVVVTDDQGVVPAFVGGDADSDTELDPGETWTYQASGTAVAGQYTNVATVDGVDVLELPVTDTDPSNYFGASPAIRIDKTPNTASVPLGNPHTFTITVTNIGNVDLTNVTVTDPVVPACDRVIGDLAAAGVSTYTCDVAEVLETIVNTASVVGTAPDQSTVADEDDARVVPVPSLVGDLVWNDLDKDGKQDPGEQGIADARVDITDLDRGGTQTYTTNATGNYLAELRPGNYRVALDMSSVESTLTTPGEYTIALAADETRLDADFGIVHDSAVAPDTASAIDQLGRILADPARAPGIVGVAALIVGSLATTVILLWIRRRRPDTVSDAGGTPAGNP